MNSPVIICPHNMRLLRGLEGREIAVRVRDPRSTARAAEDVRAVGGSLVCVVVDPALPLDRLEWGELPAAVPSVVIAPSFGAFRDLARNIPLLQSLDVAIHLPANIPDNVTGLRILASLGIRCAAVIGPGKLDWDALADLAAYAVLGPVPHAAIEPFASIASRLGPSSPIHWDFPYFWDSRRFLHMDDKGRLAPEKGASPGAPAGPCACCMGWKTCRGRFAAEAGEGKCSSFLEEMADIALRARKKAQSGAGEADPTPPAVPGEPALIEKSQERPAKASKRTGGQEWIDLRGGAGHALMLSGILKQVLEQHPSRRYNLVARTGFTPILRGHPAIKGTGHPPKGAKVLTIGPGGGANIPKPEQREYQLLAASLGLKTPVEERLWVPWEFEDDPTLMAILPHKERRVLISTASDSPRKEMPPERWESLVALLANDGIAVVQAGDTKDPYIRGAYNILGLLTQKQLISLPRHFDAVVTTDALMMHAARLCQTPCMVLGDSPGPVPGTTRPSTIHRAIVNLVKTGKT